MRMSARSVSLARSVFTYRGGGHALIRIVVSSCGNILKHVSSLVLKLSFNRSRTEAYRRQFLL